MSRGHGQIQRHILEVTRHVGVYPLIYIAQAFDYDVTALAVRQSFMRAARKLADEELIDLYDITVPTARSEWTGNYVNNRNVTCAAWAGQGDYLTDEDWAACRRMAISVYFPDTMAQIEQEENEDDHIARTVIRVLEGDITRERVVTTLSATKSVPTYRVDAIADHVMELIDEPPTRTETQ